MLLIKINVLNFGIFLRQFQYLSSKIPILKFMSITALLSMFNNAVILLEMNFSVVFYMER